MKLPRAIAIRQNDTRRLIPAKYGDSVLTRIADDDAHLQDIFDLDHATNDRLLAENGRSAFLEPSELVCKIPHAAIINAAFCHPNPLGGRFNGPERGAWYAGFAVETAQAEVAFHHTVALAEVGMFRDTVFYDDYLADVAGEYHDLRNAPEFALCLAPDSYVESQALGNALLNAGALGVIYPCVRQKEGTCVACFRPAAVTHVRKAGTWQFVWRDAPTPSIERWPLTSPLGG